jgi:GT2 family glycosyltransferase
MLERLFTVLVNWNLKEDTLACVESLQMAGAMPGTVIVVDNGSTDDSVAAFQARFGSSVIVLETGQNLGFAGGVNHGVPYALANEARWVLLINNDTLVAGNFFNALSQAVELSSERYAILAPLIYYHNEPKRIWYLGDRQIGGTLITHSLFKNQTDTGNLPPIVPVDFVSGCGMLVKAEVFERVGLFDPSFFMYGEEVDFCRRAQKAGFQLACSTQAHMWHKVSLSANRDKAATRYHRICNQIRFYRKHAGQAHQLLLGCFTLLRAMRLAWGDMRHNTRHLIAPLMRGWVDGWFK